MKVSKLNEFVIWLLVNIFAPMVVPLCFAFLVKIVVYIDKGFLDIVEMLWIGGAYIFLSLFVLISLIPHFFDNQIHNKKSVSLCYIIVTVIVLLFTCFLYLSYLNFIQEGVPFTENLIMSICVTILGVIIAIGFKIKFLMIKRENGLIGTDYNEE
jgi:hypothetical protein